LDPNDVTRWEVETGLRRKEEQGITLIPVFVMGARTPQKGDLPNSLHELVTVQGINLRNYPDFDRDMENLVRDIRNSRGFREDDITTVDFEPKTIYITEGPFWMGSSPGEGIPDHETPRHEVKLPAYRIGKYPVTNAQFEKFISETGRLAAPSMGWEGQKVPTGLVDHPVSGVTWYEALAYCQWLSEESGRKYTLPNEAQWEKACRGGKNTIYPWGDEFDPARSNYGQPDIAPVDKYPPQNEFGCFDFVGNVRQWTCTLWGEKRMIPEPQFTYPWKEDGRNNLDAPSIIRRVLRGGMVSNSLKGLVCSARSSNAPDNPGAPGKRMGFRVVLKVFENKL
jgi:formylglycine-generating enzyme required for sulfatase activity